MQTYRVETTVSNDGTLTIKELPFKAGTKKLSCMVASSSKNIVSGYPLHGTPVYYVDPFESVAQDDWDVLQ